MVLNISVVGNLSIVILFSKVDTYAVSVIMQHLIFSNVLERNVVT